MRRSGTNRRSVRSIRSPCTKTTTRERERRAPRRRSASCSRCIPRARSGGASGACSSPPLPPPAWVHEEVHDRGADHGRMSASVNTAEPEWPWVQSGSPPSHRVRDPGGGQGEHVLPRVEERLVPGAPGEDHVRDREGDGGDPDRRAVAESTRRLRSTVEAMLSMALPVTWRARGSRRTGSR